MSNQELASSWNYLQTYVDEPELSGPEADAESSYKNPGLSGRWAAGQRGVRNWGADVGSRVRGLPAPGGIGALVVILMILLLALIPVGGANETRLQLMYDVLRGDRGLPLPITSSSSAGGYGPGTIIGPFQPPIIGGSGGGGVNIIPDTPPLLPPGTIIDMSGVPAV